MFRSCLFRLLAVPLAVILLFAGYETVQVLRARASTPAALATVAKRPLKLASVPQKRRDMLLAVEDPGFYRHHGVDFSTPGSGWTTITQSLVKHLYFPDGFKPGFAKIEQSLIAWLVLDPAVPKDEQLEIYLNYTGFGTVDGRAVTGFGDAARTFYGRPLAELSDREYLSLVAMPIAPDELDPRAHAKENANRVDRIEALLAGRCKPIDAFDVRYPACDLPRPSS
jgi:membrane carboxypeptidase/penicillin-binding protein